MDKHSYMKIAGLCWLALWLAACSSTPEIRDSAPRTSKAELMKVPDAVPRKERVTKAGNKNPYTVFGKTYYLMSQSRGYKASGTASWYGTKFHGRSTANGETYDMRAMTAAHKTLPIPCYVKVRNKLNNRTVVVRVNDRGPFHGNRLIDLSYAAAVKLGFADRGTAPVEIEVVTEKQPDPARMARVPVQESRPLPPVAAARPQVPVPVPVRSTQPQHWYLQAAAFYQAQPAKALQQRLRYITRLPVNIEAEPDTDTTIYRVRIGPSAEQAPLLKLQQEMLAVQMGNPFLVSSNSR